MVHEAEGDSSSSESDEDGYASGGTPNHGVVIKRKKGLPAAAKVILSFPHEVSLRFLMQTQRGATKPRQSNHDSRNHASATEHSPSDSEAAVHDSRQPPPAAPEASQGASAAIRMISTSLLEALS